MPKPRVGEKKSDFISRAISIIMREPGTKSRDHAVAKASGVWRQHLKNKRKQ